MWEWGDIDDEPHTANVSVRGASFHSQTRIQQGEYGTGGQPERNIVLGV